MQIKLITKAKIQKGEIRANANKSFQYLKKKKTQYTKKKPDLLIVLNGCEH